MFCGLSSVSHWQYLSINRSNQSMKHWLRSCRPSYRQLVSIRRPSLYQYPPWHAIAQPVVWRPLLCHCKGVCYQISNLERDVGLAGEHRIPHILAMAITLPISRMSREDKLRAMEELWADLSRDEA